MRPTIKLDSAKTPDGRTLDLFQHDEEFFIQQGRITVMSSRAHSSEEELARLGLEKIKGRSKPVVLVGGLGLGFTLRAALDNLPKSAKVIVAEILEPVVRWNKEIFGHLAGNPLHDKRVEVYLGDVTDLIATSSSEFDAILLDVDNGPEAFVVGTNIDLYTDVGLAICHNALRSAGVLAVWSTHSSKHFTKRLKSSGYAVEEIRCTPRKKKGTRSHLLWIAQAKKAKASRARRSKSAPPRQRANRGRKKKR